MTRSFWSNLSPGKLKIDLPDAIDLHQKSQQELKKAETGFAETADFVAGIGATARSSQAAITRVFTEFLNGETAHHAGIVEQFDLPSTGSWSDPRWAAWIPAGDTAPSDVLRLGNLVHVLNGKVIAELPWLIPLIGSRPSLGLGFISDSNRHGDALAIMRSMVLRLLASMPFDVKFTLLDPQVEQAFPMQRDLVEIDINLVRQVGHDMVQELQRIAADVRRIATDVLRHRESFEDVDVSERRADRFEFIFVPGFPHGYSQDRRVLDALTLIAKAGPKVGRYLILEVDRGAALPRDFTLDRFENLRWINLTESVRDYLPFVPRPDDVPHSEEQQRLFNLIRQAKRPEVSQCWGDIVALPEQEWWNNSGKDFVETPVGRDLRLWFGQKEGRGH